jgi:hypothetical protein
LEERQRHSREIGLETKGDRGQRQSRVGGDTETEQIVGGEMRHSRDRNQRQSRELKETKRQQIVGEETDKAEKWGQRQSRELKDTEQIVGEEIGARDNAKSYRRDRYKA